MTYQAVIDFWFNELDSAQWFAKSDALDATIRQRFAVLHAQAVQGDLAEWRLADQGVLAEIILLDQFSRNIYRDTAGAFAYDGQALFLAQDAVRRGVHQRLSDAHSMFLLMPFMHSESILVHETASFLFHETEDDNFIQFEKQHAAIIKQFGRYPHRNAFLGRESSPDELQFLQEHVGF